MAIPATSLQNAQAWFRFARERKRSQLEAWSGVGDWVSQISHLVHMLQRERGASNIWLCSGGQLFARERAFCVTETDQRAAQFRAVPVPVATAGSLLSWHMACALWQLEQLPGLRARILAREIEPGEAMESFNQAIRHLLDLVPEASESVDEASLARALTALYSFMQGKELAGQERAIGAIGFTQGAFSEPLRQRLADRIDGQQRCFETFLSLACADIRERFYRHGEATRELEQLRRLACTRLPADDPRARAVRWFGLQTTRLDALRDIEEALIAALLAEAHRLLAQEAHSETPEAALARRASLRDEPQTPALERHLLPLVRQQAREVESLTRQLASLQANLEERKLIDRAKSLLMSHQQLSEEQAWHQLRKLAMDQNKRMVEIAEAMLAVARLWPVTPKE
ncbi:ANTAR domain-containing protein [Cronobacter sakazakii]|uniref:nitrate regulatory protein n=1 Tax=Cronobacter sakazakii TaxID=28141 RepID=UPI000CF0D1B4|nr:nitrate regulatory protein [Cronobacter sakazakii]EGT5183217.1 ANTAR domain-containing protein [Cronobacter sakazakii]EGT5764349.1 ANTAR domain-containing protein [Cronobacter sakazakii]EJG0741017.1 nitrate- and nitrite sensing domain-containing protein [Cronobacter sakazakii]EJG0745178.1 nitrate- and nitrite sensing domain-containing protein [Cronobacter sakazakii]ELY2534689.1 nitrate- and nitrite sensing domain-containing protein [Cronobacter sakazakii]